MMLLLQEISSLPTPSPDPAPSPLVPSLSPLLTAPIVCPIFFIEKARRKAQAILDALNPKFLCFASNV